MTPTKYERYFSLTPLTFAFCVQAHSASIFKVPMTMKQNFVQYFLDCIAKITLNHNITSSSRIFELCSLLRYSTLLDTQCVTSHSIMSARVCKFAYFVACNNRK